MSRNIRMMKKYDRENINGYVTFIQNLKAEEKINLTIKRTLKMIKKNPRAAAGLARRSAMFIAHAKNWTQCAERVEEMYYVEIMKKGGML